MIFTIEEINSLRIRKSVEPLPVKRSYIELVATLRKERGSTVNLSNLYTKFIMWYESNRIVRIKRYGRIYKSIIEVALYGEPYFCFKKRHNGRRYLLSESDEVMGFI